MEKVVKVNGEILDYLVNDLGVIFSTKRMHKNVISYGDVKGYKICYMYHKGKRKDLLVHRVVATAFIPNPENKPQVNHKDGNKSNNKVCNLEWCSQSENINHAYKNGFMSKTFKDCYNSSLTDEQVFEIRILISNKIKQRDIAKKYNVSEQIISNIKSGRSYPNAGLAIDKSKI